MPSTAQRHKGGAVDRNRAYIEDNFDKMPILAATMDLSTTYLNTDSEIAILANKLWCISATTQAANSSNDDITLSTGGGIQVQTDTASDDNVILTPLTAIQSKEFSPLNVWDWNTDDQISIGMIIETGASVADVIFFFGLKLTDTDVVATDDDGVFFRYESGVANGQFQCCSVDAARTTAGTGVGEDDETINTAVAVAASTQYKLEIHIDRDRVPTFTINDANLQTGTALAAATDLLPFIGFETKVSSAKTIHYRRFWISKEYAN